MAKQPANHSIDCVSEQLPASAAHQVLAILAGDATPNPDDDTADSVARFIIRLGWGGLAPDTPEADAVRGPTPWFVRVTFPGIAPPDAFIVAMATASGLRVESLAQGPPGSPFAAGSVHSRATGDRPSRWLLVAPQSREAVSSAVAQLLAVHRIHVVPFRKIEN